MSLNNLRPDAAYGLSSALINTPPQPIVAARAPTTNDKAPIGQEWVVPSANTVYFLTSIVNNLANWLLVATSGGSGVFATVTTTGVNGSGAGITANVGNIIASTGNIGATVGNIVATAGAVNAGTSMNATTTITAGTGITSTTGNIVATAGVVEAGTVLRAAGDVAGVATTTSLSNVVSTALSTGALSILSESANNGNNAGFIKMYVGTAVVFIPYFTVIAP
jgi:hypothetical protein